MVELIEQLTIGRSGQRDILFIAISIADRYLAMLTVYEEPAPSLIELGMVSVLIASKFVTNRNPNLSQLIDTVNGWNIKEIWKADLLQLEVDVLTSLDFNLNFETPINFLDRFIMLLNSPDYNLKDIKNIS